MQYSIVKKSNPQNRDEVKYYAAPVYGEKITLRDIAEDLADASTLNSIDIMATIEGFIKAVVKYVAKGNRVYLGDFGIFKLSFSSCGQKKAEDVTGNDIDQIRIVYRAGSLVKHNLANKVNFTYQGDYTTGSTGEADDKE